MEKKKLSKREKDKLRHRRQMLAAALKLFSEKGYHNVSMHEIAERAEFAIGTLYKFFKNKEDLYKSLMMEKAAEYHHTLSEALSREGDVLTILKDYISAKASIFADDVRIARATGFDTGKRHPRKCPSESTSLLYGRGLRGAHQRFSLLLV